MSITSQNLRIKNISARVINVITNKDKGKEKNIILKINLNGHNTGNSVKVSRAFFEDEPLKKEVILYLEEKLNREVDFGTRHIYVGNKLA